jgi:hypothetical protein
VRLVISLTLLVIHWNKFLDYCPENDLCEFAIATGVLQRMNKHISTNEAYSTGRLLGEAHVPTRKLIS